MHERQPGKGRALSKTWDNRDQGFSKCGHRPAAWRLQTWELDENVSSQAQPENYQVSNGVGGAQRSV